MSIARQEFLRNVAGVGEAINFDPIAQGAVGAAISPGIIVLRRGVLVAGFVALESFVRDRTQEISLTFQRWPRSFDDLPDKLRLLARLEALNHLARFASLLKRQGENFEAELQTEIEKMASGHGSVLTFTKFISGDYTGNVSADGFSNLLKAFQVRDPWTAFRSFAADTGFGIPSVEQIFKNIVQARHRSAHVVGFVPNATDIAELKTEILCIGMCFDVALTASSEFAVVDSNAWLDPAFNWRDRVNLYLARHSGGKFRVTKFSKSRATAVEETLHAAKARIPAAAAGAINVVVELDSASKPSAWSIL